MGYSIGKALNPPIRPNDQVVYQVSYGPGGAIQLGHPHIQAEKVNEVSFSPNGKYVLTASGTARVWDAATGKPTPVVLIHLDSGGQASTINAAAFSPDGGRIVTGGDDCTARVWSASTGKPITPPLPHHASVGVVHFSPDGKRILTASFQHPDVSDSGAARVWDAQTGRSIMPVFPELMHGRPVVSACFSPDGSRIATAAGDGTARVWDVATGRPITPPIRHGDRVRCVAFSPDGQKIVTGSDDKTARIWDAQTGGASPPVPYYSRGITVARFSRDGRRFLTASQFQGACVWDARTGRPVGPTVATTDRGIGDADLSPDGQWIATLTGDGNVQVWSAATGKAVLPLLNRQGTNIDATVRYDPTGQKLWVAWKQGFLVWDASTGQKLKDSQDPLWLSPDGKWALSASNTGAATIWDTTTGQVSGQTLPHPGLVTSAWFSGNYVATAADHHLRIWEAATGKPVSPPLEHRAMGVTKLSNPIHAQAFIPDGNGVVTGTTRGLRGWSLKADLDEPVELLTLETELVAGLRMDPDGAVRRLERADYQELWRRWEHEAQSHADQCKFPEANRWRSSQPGLK